jgi:hypothetical protein
MGEECRDPRIDQGRSAPRGPGDVHEEAVAHDRH